MDSQVEAAIKACVTCQLPDKKSSNTPKHLCSQFHFHTLHGIRLQLLLWDLLILLPLDIVMLLL